MAVVFRVCLPCLLWLALSFLAAEARSDQLADEKLKEIERVAGGEAVGRTTIPKLPQPAVRLYVAPDGSDADAGSEVKPFATLERARDEVRAIKQRGGLPSGGVAVEVRGGEYPVKQTFALTADDSGTEDAPIVYRAYRDETPAFRGGIRLSGFTPVADAAVLARLPEEARGKVV
ncbi:MAG: hypothetical protein NTU83_11850, partial [Candidatus Hydrogenedentes bacterium]|nr:hypothetical protein [Candidatus Hydrogenedentota bacterium]